MNAPTTKITFEVTATMLNFLDEQVRDGRAWNRGEALRFLIAFEIKRWEKLRNRAFTPATFRVS